MEWFLVCLLLISVDIWRGNEIFGLKIMDQNVTVTIQIESYDINAEGDLVALKTMVPFQFNLANPELDWLTAEFCTENKLTAGQCDTLFQQIIQIRYDYVEQDMIQSQLTQNLKIIKAQLIPNKHLRRSAFAMNTEINNYLQRKANYESIMRDIFNTVEEMITLLQQNHDLPNLSHTEINQYDLSSKTIIFIHSCSIVGENNRILLDLLDTIFRSGLSKRIENLFVLNYGIAVSEEVSRLTSNSKKIKLLHVSNDTSYFEVPTMMIMHEVMKKITDHGDEEKEPFNLLYLHTKGVSYQQIYPQIEDWRALMLYFLVERYPACLSLLASGAFDAVGVNYKSNPRDFRGNFWWTTSSYFRKLPSLDLLQSDKYTAEKWLHLNSDYRVYSFHESNVDHHFDLYPRSRYELHNDAESEVLEGNEEEKESALCVGYSLFWQEDMIKRS